MEFISDMTVELKAQAGSDLQIVRAARVSVEGLDSPAGEREDPDDQAGLIRYLMKHRHASPFEHGMMTVFVHAPIFVLREMMRHRWLSFNEESARYKKLEPVFWIPRQDRKMIPVEGFKSARPEFSVASKEQWQYACDYIDMSCASAYKKYEWMIADGIAREVARVILPVGIYSSAWVTGNPRAWMSFLSLRTVDGRAATTSYPQSEIQEVATKIEVCFAVNFPITYDAWNANGRQAI